MTKVIVYHSGYGCDTGCCGHRIEIGDRHEFVFDHADAQTESVRQFAERIVREKLGAEHVADLDWANSTVVDYDSCPM